MATALNPPAPAGAKIWTRPVPPEMSAWASSIVHDPTTYPMGATATQVFGGVTAFARVEWHTWTNRGGQRVSVSPPIRGVTVYDLGGTSGAPMPLVPTVPPTVQAGVQGANAGVAMAFGAGGAAAYWLTRWLQDRLARA